MSSPRDRFGATVSIELGEDCRDMELGGVDRDSQPRHVLELLLDASSPASEESLRDDGASRVLLTPREHEVLAAMADGASNKVIHEFIHVIQWRVLGAERFLRSYADGLERFGYRDSPLEVMAYDAEARFVASTAGFDAEELVAENLARVT